MVVRGGTPARFGNAPTGKLLAARLSAKGGAWDSDWLITQLPGSASKIPKPPRTDVLPSRKGSQAKPTRGSKL